MLTHGYIHGHVHKHSDHMHIHGHIHNHDHQESSEQTTNGKNEELCSQFDDMCNEIFCDELDDCYYQSCENTRVGNCVDCFPEESFDQCCQKADCEEAAEVECCEDPECLHEMDAICHDPKCLDGNEVVDHENNLCDSQAQKMSIFKNILESVQRGIEKPELNSQRNRANLALLKANTLNKRRKIESLDEDNFQIHFPHRCHSLASSTNQDNCITSGEVLRRSETPILPSNGNSPANVHHTHQSCFHARVPSSQLEATSTFPPPSDKQQNDFDFFIQFNNFNQFLEEEEKKAQAQPDIESSLLGAQSPNAPTSYSCKWENCFKKVDDTTLLNHLIDEHINAEYHLDNKEKEHNQAFQCEWNNCSFSNANLNSFISHLNSHKGMMGYKPGRNEPMINESVPLAPSPLLTPNSASPSVTSPLQLKKEDGSGLNITSMEILPKAETSHEGLDADFTCKWQIGTTATGEPVVCGNTHSSDGDLQHHLQQDHIGLGKSQYECCWIGCERNGGKPFVQRQKLYRHIHIHTNYKPCKCEICGCSFAVPATLRQHMRTHSGERPFTCSFCGKKFSTSSSLSIHNRVHSGIRPLECKWPGCGKRFSESSNLAKHMRVHTKSYKCEECGEIFEIKKDLTKHKKSHRKQLNHDTVLLRDVMGNIKGEGTEIDV